MEFHHQTVLLKETIDGLNIKPNGIYVDCTLGGGGHSSQILQRLAPEGILVAFDQDQEALSIASQRLAEYPQHKIFIHSNFGKLKEQLNKHNIMTVDGILMDIGVSSYQLDNEERGFSYQNNAELDMRMDKSQPYTAKDVVNTLSEQELTKVISTYGEEKWAKRIAQFIVAAREKQEITTTFELVEIIKNAIPAGARRSGPHPAKRTFQSLRIFLNRELEVLEAALKDAVEVLNEEGRIAIITFHSLEDRIVKDLYRAYANPCICPPALPYCSCGLKPKLKIITGKPILPSNEEIDDNPRSRSAKLRIAQKI